MILCSVPIATETRQFQVQLRTLLSASKSSLMEDKHYATIILTIIRHVIQAQPSQLVHFWGKVDLIPTLLLPSLFAQN